MPQTSREIVKKCLKFENPERVPRDLWLLPWTMTHFPEVTEKLNQLYPSDICEVEWSYPSSARAKGNPYLVGYYTDEWGCTFKNINAGLFGEVKTPIIQDIKDWKMVKPPYEQLPINKDKPCEKISQFYESTDKFVKASCCPRPWERYQFLRGTENAMIDIMMPDKGGSKLLKVIHDFYLTELEFWVKADVDAIWFMDDWGAQNQLLIPPEIWCELFKPLYKEYCELAHSYGKFALMHSDGYITEIFEDFIEIGVDAINSQLFCMDLQELEKKAKGKITFWGEIDRQHILPAKDPQVGRDAVQKLVRHFYDPAGGIIAQFELGPDANPDTAFAIFDEWDKINAGC